MKKLVYISSLFAVALSMAFSSCTHEMDDIFSKPAADRTTETMEFYRKALVEQGGKWQMEYFTQDIEQGYVYLFTFYKNGSVAISGKNPCIGALYTIDNPQNTFGCDTSAWEITPDDGPTLTLNTYNKFFHIFSEPEDILQTGDSETGYGHRGDYEFNLMRYTGDSLIMRGKKNAIQIVMTRVDENTNDEAYLDDVCALADSFFNALVPETYLQLGTGRRYIIKNGSSLILETYPEWYYYVKKDIIEPGDPISQTESHNAIITPAGLTFMNPVKFYPNVKDSTEVVELQHFTRMPDGALVCRDGYEGVIKADSLNNLIQHPEICWRIDTKDMGGKMKELYDGAVDGMTKYNKKFKMQYIQLGAYYSKQAINGFGFTWLYKNGSSVTPCILAYQPQTREGEDIVKFNIITDKSGNDNNNGPTIYSKVPAIQSLVEYFNTTKFKITANSVLAPTKIMLTNVDNPNDYAFFYMTRN